MVDITPFRAIRYDSDKVGDLSKVIAPPYDVIAPALQDELYAQHERNIVRIDLNKPEAGDEELSRYTRSADFLEAWKKDGVLVQDDSPSIYVLSQTFTGPDGVERTRTGFFGRARLTPFADGPILPHERTLKGPKKDRLELFRATETNLSPIFGAYHDEDGAIAALLAQTTKAPPTSVAMLGPVKNEMWRVSDGAVLEKLTALFEPKKLYIADGHHRYETGLAYKSESSSENADHILMFSAAVEDPGMVIFPTHRLVHSLADFDEAKVLEALAPFFNASSAPDDPQEGLVALERAGQGTNALIFATKKNRHLLVAKSGAPWRSVDPLPTHEALRSLDVSVLHAVVYEHVLGISLESQAKQENLRYSKDWNQAWNAPHDNEDVQAAFLMNPTKIEEVIEVAESGEVMPQKSTFFYPKLPSGLVLYPLS